MAFAKYNLIPFRFGLVARHVFKRILSALGLKRGYRIIDLAVTYKCNLTCAHCSALIMEQDKEPLTLTDYEKIVQDAKKLDVLSWNITGGEPLLLNWLDDLIQLLEPQKHYISVQTNCLRLTPERARKLAKAGVNCITTSLDSIDPNEHDHFRGRRKAFEKTMEGISNAINAGMQVLVGGVVTHQNLRSPDFEQLIRKVNRAGAIFLFNLAVPCGNWRDQNEFILRGDDRAYLKMLMTKYPLTSTDHEVGRNQVGCPSGVEKAYITPYGDVIPCPFIHVSFGNVRHQPLTRIVKKMQQVNWFNNYQDVCIAAEDKKFHQLVFKKIQSSPGPFPVNSEKVFPDES